MALSEKSRSTLYQGFTTLLADEEAVEEMLSYFPARDVEEPATKEFIRAETAELRGEMAELHAELRGEMAELRAELRGEMAELRAELRGEMAELRADMERMVRTMQSWMVGTAISVGGLVIASNAAFG